MDQLDPAIAAWLADVLPGRRIVRADTLSGGFRNLNIRLTTDTGERCVLRQFRHRNTCAVEAGLAARLAGVVPVAEVIAADPRGAVAGRPVLLSRFVDGTMLSTVLSTVDDSVARRLGYAVGETLAAIGTVTLARPGFFAERTEPDGTELDGTESGSIEPDSTESGSIEPDGTEPTADLPAFVERCLCEGNAGHALTAAEQDAFLRLATERAALLDAVAGSRQLVHSDFNPKNLLVDENGAVTAVLDWEFALSSSPLIDIGNMLRFRDELPPAYAEAFPAGFAGAGGRLPANWTELGQTLDLFSLAEFLTRPPDHPFFGKAADLIRRQLR